MRACVCLPVPDVATVASASAIVSAGISARSVSQCDAKVYAGGVADRTLHTAAHYVEAAGTGLMEIVTGPDIRSGKEAAVSQHHVCCTWSSRGLAGCVALRCTFFHTRLVLICPGPQAFTQQLMLILQRLETCDANMASERLRSPLCHLSLSPYARQAASSLFLLFLLFLLIFRLRLLLSSFLLLCSRPVRASQGADVTPFLVTVMKDAS